MKKIIIDGILTTVPLNTPSKNINGVEYPLTPEEIQEFDLRANEYNALAPERERAKIIKNRMREYGTALEQIEFLVENGLEALQQRNNAIKLLYPKN